jgi:hypothetical protein
VEVDTGEPIMNGRNFTPFAIKENLDRPKVFRIPSDIDDLGPGPDEPSREVSVVILDAHDNDACPRDFSVYAKPECQPFAPLVWQRTERIVAVGYIFFPLLARCDPSEASMRRIVVNIDNPTDECEGDV